MEGCIMKRAWLFPWSFLILTAYFYFACGGEGSDEGNPGDPGNGGNDTSFTVKAGIVNISQSGSLQNPAWSPDGKKLLLTRWRSGYNVGPADLLIVTLANGSVKTLVSNGEDNVNLPGSTWNKMTGRITFSSTKGDHDEIYVIGENESSGREVRVTNRSGNVAYEPSFSPDGQFVVFESHTNDDEENGIITKFRVSGGSYEELTQNGDDCREPNWSPKGDLIVYQQLRNDRWDLWVMNTDGSGKKQITTGSGDKTDASFSPDGRWVIYSTDNGQLDLANVYAVSVSGGSPIRVTSHSNAYDGAPSWSPDGKYVAYESFNGDPDNSPGTKIWLAEVPASLK